jgi:hypothetical protein
VRCKEVVSFVYLKFTIHTVLGRADIVNERVLILLITSINNVLF